MSNAVHNLNPEYWVPASTGPAPVQPEKAKATACEPCGAEFLIGARYCHVCGSRRGALARGAGVWPRIIQWMNSEPLGLTPLPLGAALLGLLCLVTAVAVGFLFRASTLLDWQAIQFWRVEWLLAAVAFFLLGILLKKS